MVYLGMRKVLIVSFCAAVFGWQMSEYPAGTTTPDYICTITPTESCPMHDYPAGSTVLIYPGGKTRCQESTSPYSFIVRPGHTDQLMFYMQGGGACWDADSYNSDYCAKTPILQDANGVFTDTVFGSFTQVVALYCSGDLFISNATRDFTDNNGNFVEQRGIENMLAVMEWTKAQMKDSPTSPAYLDMMLAKMVLMGVSAGAVAVPIWSNTLFTLLPSVLYGAVSDSYVLFMPSNIEGELLRDTANFCQFSTLLPPSLLDTCLAGSLRIADLYIHNMRLWPKVAFTNIQAKMDSTQAFYYNAVLMSQGMLPIQASAYYTRSLVVINELNLEPNYVIFMIDSTAHGYTYTNRYIMADQYSDSGAVNNPGVGVALESWVLLVPLAEGETMQSVCGGDNCPSEVIAKSFTAELAPSVSCFQIKSWIAP